MPGLKKAATIALQEVLRLRSGEEVLILTNPEETVFTIAKALFEETRVLGGKPVLLMQEKKVTATYADRLVLEAVRAEPDILITLTKARVGKDPYGLQIGYVSRDGRRFDNIVDKVTKGDRRVRGFSSPNANPGMFARCVPLDYDALRQRAYRLKETAGQRQNCPGDIARLGTDIRFSIVGRRTFANTGDYRLPGCFGNLPAGEVYISPALGSGTGKIAFDGTLSTLEGPVIPEVPVVISFKDGFVEQIYGGPLADRVRRTIEEGEAMARAVGNEEEGRNCRHLGEFGIGINDNAQITGVILEDEKALKTCHFALGSNYDFDAPAIIHRDMLVMNPSVWIDDEPIMKNGDLLL